jgi:short-subunit dehydrogenase
MKAFAGNAVILTGASRGIGEQLAYTLAAQGARLALAARSEEQLHIVAQRCRALGGEALVVPVDLTDEEACRNLIARTVEQYGRIDTLLYNAGVAFPKRFRELTDLSTLRQEMALNYFGLAACSHAALPYLLQTKGRLVVVGSLNSFAGMGGTIGYNSSKHALRGFANTLRNELRGTGVTVTATYPGAVAVERLGRVMGQNARRARAMTPQDAAARIVSAAASRRREVVFPAMVRFALWAYRFFPRLMDRQFARVADWYVYE